VTVDTEFLRESTYYPQLCVAQMASAEEAVVVDALAAGIDLAPFFALMVDPAVIKVFMPPARTSKSAGTRPDHSGTAGRHPGRRHGARLRRSFPTTSLSRSPASRQVAPLHRLDAAAALRRNSYAISDVTHLRDVYVKLAADLDKQGRTDWMREEMKVLNSPDTYRMEPEHAWQRLKTRVRKPKELAVLIEVAAWREREAQTRDVPRGRVLKDDLIGDIAVQAPATIERLGSLRSLPKGFERSRWGEAIVEAVKRGAIRANCRSSSARARASTATQRSNCSRCCCA
jgi:ribonuclease D